MGEVGQTTEGLGAKNSFRDETDGGLFFLIFFGALFFVVCSYFSLQTNVYTPIGAVKRLGVAPLRLSSIVQNVSDNPDTHRQAPQADNNL